MSGPLIVSCYIIYCYSVPLNSALTAPGAMKPGGKLTHLHVNDTKTAAIEFLIITKRRALDSLTPPLRRRNISMFTSDWFSTKRTLTGQCFTSLTYSEVIGSSERSAERRRADILSYLHTVSWLVRAERLLSSVSTRAVNRRQWRVCAALISALLFIKGNLVWRSSCSSWRKRFDLVIMPGRNRLEGGFYLDSSGAFLLS